MDPNHEIKSTSPRHPLNMAEWCVEKSSNVTEGITKVFEILEDEEFEISESAKNEIIGCLYPALYHALKMMAFSAGGEWDYQDRDEIIKGGLDSYKKIAKKYGIVRSNREL